MCFEHERIHIETSSVLMRELPAHLLRRPPQWPAYHASVGDAARPPPPNELIAGGWGWGRGYGRVGRAGRAGSGARGGWEGAGWPRVVMCGARWPCAVALCGERGEVPALYGSGESAHTTRSAHANGLPPAAAAACSGCGGGGGGQARRLPLLRLGQRVRLPRLPRARLPRHARPGQVGSAAAAAEHGVREAAATARRRASGQGVGRAGVEPGRAGARWRRDAGLAAATVISCPPTAPLPLPWLPSPCASHATPPPTPRVLAFLPRPAATPSSWNLCGTAATAASSGGARRGGAGAPSATPSGLPSGCQMGRRVRRRPAARARLPGVAAACASEWPARPGRRMPLPPQLPPHLPSAFASHPHTHTHTHSLSLSLSLCAGLHRYRLRLVFEVADMAPALPAVVNHHEAHAYAAWLSARLGLRGDAALRLLTEPEHHRLREVAARDGEGRAAADPGGWVGGWVVPAPRCLPAAAPPAPLPVPLPLPRGQHAQQPRWPAQPPLVRPSHQQTHTHSRTPPRSLLTPLGCPLPSLAFLFLLRLLQ